MQRIKTKYYCFCAIYKFLSSNLLKLCVAAFLAASLLVSGCGAQHQQAINSDEYVEIDNPYSGHASPKIWVPKYMTEKGMPRGSDLVKKGYEKTFGATAESSTAGEAGKPSNNVIRKRLLVAEAGAQIIGDQLRRLLSQNTIVNGVSSPSAHEQLDEKEQSTYLASFADRLSGGPLLLVSKPEGTKPGARIRADLYDIRSSQLIRPQWVTIPQVVQGHSTDDALLSALKGLADATLSTLERVTWYGRVIRVSGERVYVDSGADTGLSVGQRLLVYRGGEFIKGYGFAPGVKITSFPIAGVFGPDSSYGISQQAASVKAGDYVELEK